MHPLPTKPLTPPILRYDNPRINESYWLMENFSSPQEAAQYGYLPAPTTYAMLERIARKLKATISEACFISFALMATTQRDEGKQVVWAQNYGKLFAIAVEPKALAEAFPKPQTHNQQ